MSAVLRGLMQDDFPLTLHHIRRRMRTCSPQAQVVTLIEPGSVARASRSMRSATSPKLAFATDPGSISVTTCA